MIALHLQALQGTGNLSTPQAALVFHNPMDMQVERCIQTVKRLLKKAELAKEDPFFALLECRNTPLDGTDGYSPAEMLSSRLLRSKVPTAASLLKPHVVPPLQKNLQLRQAKQKFYHDRKSSKELTSLQSGDPVRFINPKGNGNLLRSRKSGIPLEAM